MNMVRPPGNAPHASTLPVSTLPVSTLSVSTLSVSAPVAPTLSVVVPAYDEAEVLPLLHARLAAVMAALGERWELVLVNDGSRDATLAVMAALRGADPHVAVLNLSRNFGKEIAMTAGLDHARGDAVVVHRRRPAGPAGADPGTGPASGARASTWSTPSAAPATGRPG